MACIWLSGLEGCWAGTWECVSEMHEWDEDGRVVTAGRLGWKLDIILVVD